MEPYWYSMYLYQKLPYAKKEEEIRKLLPHIIDPQITDDFRNSAN